MSGNKAAVPTAAPSPASAVSPFGPSGAEGGGGAVVNAVVNHVESPLTNGGGLPVEATPFQPAARGGDPGGQVGEHFILPHT
jgi:hypothetical protein